MTSSITRAVQDWRDGDDRGAFDLDRLLRAELLVLVRSRRAGHLRARIDSEGVVNAALKSFLSGVAKDEFPQVNNRHDVRQLLAWFVMCVLKDEIRQLRTKKRNLHREAGLDACTSATSREPSPEESARALEYWVKFPDVVRLVDEKAIDILELRLEGLNNTQIADKLDLGVRMVQQIIQRMVNAWEQWLAREGEDGRSGEPAWRAGE